MPMIGGLHLYFSVSYDRQNKLRDGVPVVLETTTGTRRGKEGVAVPGKSYALY